MSRRAFHRPARAVLPTLPSDPVKLPLPPEMPAENPQNTAWSLVLPLLSSVGMAAYMITFGRPELIVIGVVFFLTSTGAVLGMRISQRGIGGRAMRKQRARYRAHLQAARDQARTVAAAQRTVAAHLHPEPARLHAIAVDERRVWERRPGDEDFLRVRVGTGEVGLATPLQLDPKLDPLGDYDWHSLQAAKRLVARMAHVAGQPVTVDLADAGVVSVLGPPARTHELIRALLCQLAVHHAPDDVLVAVDTSGGGEWGWAKWLPHTFEPQARGPAGGRSLITDVPEHLDDFLAAQLRQRADAHASRRLVGSGDPRPPQQRLLLVVTGFVPFSDWGRSELLHGLLTGAGANLGITLVFVVERETDEPGRVDLQIRFDEHDHLVLERRSGGAPGPRGAVGDHVPVRLAELIARRLAPLRLSDEPDQILARTVSLAEMVLAGDPATADIAANWAGVEDAGLLRTPIGTDGEGLPVVLDVKESAQGGSGPHGLVVGATGSGKSELLRTLVTGLALRHSPDVLSFVLIDFKGGATFAPLTDLPHVAGLITNLADDAATIDRVLAALTGEQQRRQRMLRDAGNVDTVREYQRRWSAGEPGPDGRTLEPLPYLLIIVDEFSELLSGRPEFVDLFVQIGRVGRSIGMHLLLATQRLEEGRLRGLDSHLSYRICLRTFSANESRAVIGTQDAYQLPPIPGSAYLKVDESIYTRLRVAHVSSAYVSATDRSAAGPAEARIVVFGLRAAGEAAEAAEAADTVPPAPATAGPGAPTELQVVVDRMRSLTAPGHQVWLPPLPPALALDHLIGAPSVQAGRGYVSRLWPVSEPLRIPIGVIDMPLRQEQESLLMDFAGAHGHLAVVGAPQTGRSTLLRTIMLAGMLTHTPDEMQFYAIDFGGGTLHPFAAAPHVGGVAGRNDPELTARMLAELRALIGERERLFRRLGIDSIAEFRARRQAGRLPAGARAADVFLLIDNWGAMRAEHDGADQILTEIAARGLGAGLHIVLTSGRWADLRAALRDSIGSRFELRLNDPNESDVNRRLAARLPSNAPGRGLVQPGLQFQLVLPRVDGADTTGGLREAQEDVLAKIAAGWTGPAAPPIRLLPARVAVSELEPGTGEGVPVGIAEADLRPVAIDLSGQERHLVVYGDVGSGKSTALHTWLTGLTGRYTGDEVRVVLLDYRRSLMDVVPAGHLGAYAGDPARAQVYVQQVVEKLSQRQPPAGITPAQLKARDWWTGADIYVVVDDYDLVGVGAQNVLAPLVPFIPMANEVGLHLVLARRVTGLTRTAMGDQVMSRIRDLGCAGLVLSGDPREGVVTGDVRAAPRPPGRGVLVVRGRPPRLVQVAVADDRAPAEPVAAG
ncbi:type VII secretion protein EccCa [Dactylosporangium sp. NPDC000244]|uniref:type VII secretion protein EccCa n=1 Tax=Dactylosporangium sp. NPDC000244 TaxID=3154365 RepID=UPI0033266045